MRIPEPGRAEVRLGAQSLSSRSRVPGSKLSIQLTARRYQPFGAWRRPASLLTRPVHLLHPHTPVHPTPPSPYPLRSSPEQPQLPPPSFAPEPTRAAQSLECNPRARVLQEAGLGTLLSLSSAWIGCSDPLEVGLCLKQPIRGAVPCFSSPLGTGGSPHGGRGGDGRAARHEAAQHQGSWLNPCHHCKATIGRTGKSCTRRGEGTISRTLLRGESPLCPWSPSSPNPELDKLSEAI